MSDIKPFNKLGLTPNLLSTLKELGYEQPTPIQEQSIPFLLKGDDLLAQAQTGTGKTAAFALPILSHIDIKLKQPQALIIAPTRELAIQVAEAFQSYAKNLKGFHVAPIYGGQAYDIQLRALKRGAHVIVGTPGRVMDHLRRGTLKMDAIKTLVLDEADEMLRMGFVDDVEWILEQIPHAHQTALFSATMPASIQSIAKRYLKDAQKIRIKPTKNTVAAIEQFYTRASRNQKLDVLTRFLEVEKIEAAIIFTRTKNNSAEVAERLQARGYAAAALNGDMSQSLREKVIGRMKKNTLDIIVATDVAARGIDIDRITHVINYDIPHDVEAYIHRIGRTGRAGRKGTALLFVAPREDRLLKDIERAIHTTITEVEPPSQEEMNEIRSKQLAEKVMGVVTKSKKLKSHFQMVDMVMEETRCSPREVAAALSYLIQQKNPTNEIPTAEAEPESRRHKSSRRKGKPSGAPRGRDRGKGNDRGKRSPRSSKDSAGKRKPSKSTARKGKPANKRPAVGKPAKSRTRRK